MVFEDKVDAPYPATECKVSEQCRDLKRLFEDIVILPDDHRYEQRVTAQQQW